MEKSSHDLAGQRELNQFLSYSGITDGAFEHPHQGRPENVGARRERISASGPRSRAIHRKLTALRSLFAYPQLQDLHASQPRSEDYRVGRLE
jgi:hypothetical protein